MIDAVSDDDLAVLYRRAVLIGAQVALATLAREAVRRPSIAKLIPPADAYQRLIGASRGTEEALALIDEARQQAVASGGSTAAWDLMELEIYITSNNVEKAQESLARIERDHRNDPQVAAALYQLLYEAGVIPDQAPPRGGRPVAAQAAAPAMAASAAAESAAGRIWTPDSDRPASGGKSALWTPS
jgi:hypothetical protein